MTTISDTNKKYQETFLVNKSLFDRLDNYKNKSKIVNNALKLYFQREDFIRYTEKDFLDSLEIEDFTDKEINFLKNSNENKILEETISKLSF